MPQPDASKDDNTLNLPPADASADRAAALQLRTGDPTLPVLTPGARALASLVSPELQDPNFLFGRTPKPENFQEAGSSKHVRPGIEKYIEEKESAIQSEVYVRARILLIKATSTDTTVETREKILGELRDIVGDATINIGIRTTVLQAIEMDPNKVFAPLLVNLLTHEAQRSLPNLDELDKKKDVAEKAFWAINRVKPIDEAALEKADDYLELVEAECTDAAIAINDSEKIKKCLSKSLLPIIDHLSLEEASQLADTCTKFLKSKPESVKDWVKCLQKIASKLETEHAIPLAAKLVAAYRRNPEMKESLLSILCDMPFPEVTPYVFSIRKTARGSNMVWEEPIETHLRKVGDTLAKAALADPSNKRLNAAHQTAIKILRELAMESEYSMATGEQEVRFRPWLVELLMRIKLSDTQNPLLADIPEYSAGHFLLQHISHTHFTDFQSKVSDPFLTRFASEESGEREDALEHSFAKHWAQCSAEEQQSITGVLHQALWSKSPPHHNRHALSLINDYCIDKGLKGTWLSLVDNAIETITSCEDTTIVNTELGFITRVLREGSLSLTEKQAILARLNAATTEMKHAIAIPVVIEFIFVKAERLNPEGLQSAIMGRAQLPEGSTSDPHSSPDYQVFSEVLRPQPVQQQTDPNILQGPCGLTIRIISANELEIVAQVNELSAHLVNEGMKPLQFLQFIPSKSNPRIFSLRNGGGVTYGILVGGNNKMTLIPAGNPVS